MIELMQLKDGSYKLTMKYNDSSIIVDETWYFTTSIPSDAEVEKKIFSMKVQK